MQYSRLTKAITQSKADCVVIPVIDEKKLTNHGQVIDKATNRAIHQALSQGYFKGERKTLLLLQTPGIQAQSILLCHFGDLKEIDDASYATTLQQVFKELTTLNVESAIVALDDLPINRDQNWQAQQIFQALAHSSYCFKQHKSNPKLATLKKCLFVDSISNSQLRHGKALLNAMHLAKDLGNSPGNICTPQYLATQASKLAGKYPNLKATIYSEAQMRKMGMNSLLSVASGSTVPAKLIVLEYRGTKQQKSSPIALVGKGVTFDSGGISLKPGAAMDEMKYDMMGAASVLATLQAVAELKLPIHLVVVIPATENMPSGQATKPGDIVQSMSGQTIEILNTDAEGRLILCDALTFVQKQYKPKCIIDVATLTGAILVSLGKLLTGAFTNNDSLISQLKAAAENSNDKIWQMPMLDIYQSALKSNFADMANIGDRYAGSITAACFLARFIENDTPWIHLDIAGTAWNSGDAKGATGRPVPLLLEFLKNYSN